MDELTIEISRVFDRHLRNEARKAPWHRLPLRAHRIHHKVNTCRRDNSDRQALSNDAAGREHEYLLRDQGRDK